MNQFGWPSSPLVEHSTVWYCSKSLQTTSAMFGKRYTNKSETSFSCYTSAAGPRCSILLSRLVMWVYRRNKRETQVTKKRKKKKKYQSLSRRRQGQDLKTEAFAFMNSRITLLTAKRTLSPKELPDTFSERPFVLTL